MVRAKLSLKCAVGQENQCGQCSPGQCECIKDMFDSSEKLLFASNCQYLIVSKQQAIGFLSICLVTFRKCSFSSDLMTSSMMDQNSSAGSCCCRCSQQKVQHRLLPFVLQTGFTGEVLCCQMIRRIQEDQSKVASIIQGVPNLMEQLCYRHAFNSWITPLLSMSVPSLTPFVCQGF